jgi:hypothetical protein
MGHPESLSERTIPEPGISNLQRRDHSQVVDSSLMKIYFRQAPDLLDFCLKEENGAVQDVWNNGAIASLNCPLTNRLPGAPAFVLVFIENPLRGCPGLRAFRTHGD